MSNGAVNVSVPISTSDRLDSGSTGTNSFGGFGGFGAGAFTVNQRGSSSGPSPWLIGAAVAGAAGLLWFVLKRKKG